MQSDASNINNLNIALESDVKKHLHLPENTKVNVTYQADTAGKRAGKIQIAFEMPSVSRKLSPPLTGAPVKTQSPVNDDDTLILGALRDANEKMKRPFIGLSWFADKYLPQLGINLSGEEWRTILLRLTTRGDVILEKVLNKYSGREVTTIRTPDMPPASDPFAEM
jgi:hypothetical protein